MKKTIFMVILISFAFLFGCSGMSKLLHSKSELAISAVTVPVKIINGVIVVPVRINDSEKTYNFMLDTGSLNAISTKLALELGIEQKMRIISQTISGEIKDVPVGMVDKLEVGKGVVLKPAGLTIYNLDLIEHRAGVKIDGLIGNTFLRHFETTIDYEYQKLIFQLPYETNIEKIVPESNLFVMPFKVSIKEGIAPKLAGKINGTVKATFTLDTGNLGLPFIAHDTAVHAGYMDDPNLESVEIEGEPIGGYTGLYMQPIIGKLNSLQFGSMKLPPHLFVSGQSESNSLGYSVLRHYRITLNYEKGIVVFKNWESSTPHMVKSTCWIAIGIREGKYVITGLVKGSEAARAGLSAFDVILEMNGQKVEALGLEKIQQLLTDDKVDTLTFKVEGKQKLITLKKGNLLKLKSCVIQEPTK